MGSAIRLEDGWGVDTPVSDTLLHRYVLNLAAFHEATAMGGRTLRRDDVAAADLGYPVGRALAGPTRSRGTDDPAVTTATPSPHPRHAGESQGKP